RISHTFSKVSRVARRYLSINFHNLDIVNCQPLLLVYYLKKNQLKTDISYQTDCEDGTFYERFSDLTTSKTRDGVREQLYKSVFFKFNEKNPYNALFKELYPATHHSLSVIHSDTTTTLASLLQNCEAEIFNSIKPKKSKNYFTLFDAIYYSDVSDTQQI